MAAPTETRQQEPSQQEQLTDANREEIAAVFAALRTKAIPTNPTYQEEAAKASLGGVGGLNSTGKPVTCELPGEEKPVRVNYLAELTGPLRQILTLDQGSEGGFHADTRLTLSVTTTPAPDGNTQMRGESALLVKNTKPVTNFREIMEEARLFEAKFNRRQTIPQPRKRMQTPV